MTVIMFNGVSYPFLRSDSSDPILTKTDNSLWHDETRDLKKIKSLSQNIYPLGNKVALFGIFINSLYTKWFVSSWIFWKPPDTCIFALSHIFMCKSSMWPFICVVKLIYQISSSVKIVLWLLTDPQAKQTAAIGQQSLREYK